jgi:catechol 2,3-dioxygenase-like lactoylglutathione lyase family enzyme
MRARLDQDGEVLPVLAGGGAVPERAQRRRSAILKAVSVLINHAILGATDKLESARFLCDLFDLAEPEEAGPFAVVRLSSGELVQFATPPEVVPMHLAFLVDDATFDHLVGRLEALSRDHWADPRRSQAGINHNHGGRGVYFLDPSGNYLEAITAPYAGS